MFSLKISLDIQRRQEKEKKGAALDKMEQHWTCQLSTAQGCYLLICLRFLNWKIQTQVQNGRIGKFHYHRGNFQRLGNEQATSWPFIQDSHLGCKLGAGQPALAALDRLCSRNGFWQWSQVTLCTRAVQNISLASFCFVNGHPPRYSYNTFKGGKVPKAP